MSIEKYLAGNCYSEIKVGQSGADVYNINGDMILKHVERKKLEANLFDTYAREALFYQNKSKNAGGYLPTITGLMEAVRSGGDLTKVGGDGKYSKTVVCPDETQK